MYAKLLLQRNNAGRPSVIRDARKSVFLKPAPPLRRVQAFSNGRSRYAELFFKAKIASGTSKYLSQ